MDQLLQLFDLAPRDLIAIPVGMTCFYFFYRALKALVFDPYLKLEALRDGATTGALHDAHELQRKAEKLSLEIEAAIKITRDQALAQRISMLEKTTQETDILHKSATTEAQAYQASAQNQLQKEREELELSLAQESEALAVLVRSRITELAN